MSVTTDENATLRARVAELEAQLVSAADFQRDLQALREKFDKVAQDVAAGAAYCETLGWLHQKCVQTGAYDRLIDTSGRTRDGLTVQQYVVKVLGDWTYARQYVEFIANFMAFSLGDEKALYDSQLLAKMYDVEAQLAEEKTARLTAEGERNAAYRQRAIIARALAGAAFAMERDVGVGEDASESPEWRKMLFIDLPSGQVSFHVAPEDWDTLEGIPPYKREWDGHLPAERNARLAESGWVKPW